MTDLDKFIVKFSIVQALMKKSTTEMAETVGYSKPHIYKVLAGSRSASTGLIDSLNTLILFVYGSTMLGLIDSTIELLDSTTAGTLLRAGYSDGSQ